MNLSEYIEYDAIGLAQLISSGQVSAHEAQQTARQLPDASGLLALVKSEQPAGICLHKTA